jgi:Adenylate and Guanylate cyclase catalytic domain
MRPKSRRRAVFYSASKYNPIANLDKTAAACPLADSILDCCPDSRLPAEAAGERRHVTVMFCDLVDSTGIASRLDAEEWRDLVGAYLDAASAAVVELGGKVAKKLGDGLMALFGYPVAQENDAERAIRAALAIQRALAELNRKNEGTGKPALAARAAIDLGPVVIDATGEIFGDVPNVATRAQTHVGNEFRRRRPVAEKMQSMPVRLGKSCEHKSAAYRQDVYKTPHHAVTCPIPARRQ